MDKKILVIGSINMDLIVQIPQVPQGGQTLRAQEYIMSPGGKGANQAIAVALLGGDVSYVGKIGVDDNARFLRRSLDSFGLDTRHVLEIEAANTGLALILLEDTGENRIIVIAGANDCLEPEDVAAYLQNKDEYGVVVLQLEIPLRTVDFVIRQAKSLGIGVIVDAGPATQCDLGIFQDVDILSPNQTEIEVLTGQTAHTVEEGKTACEKLLRKTQAKRIILKMGELGCLIHDLQGFRHVPAYPITAVDTTAAGDAFTAGLAVGWTKKWSERDAIAFANGAGALTATKIGAHSALPTKDDVTEFLKRQGS